MGINSKPYVDGFCRIDINMDDIIINEKEVVCRPIWISRSDWMRRWEELSRNGWIKWRQIAKVID